MSARTVALLVACLMLASAAGAGQPDVTLQPGQGSGTLEIPPLGNFGQGRRAAPPPIPSEPSQSVLTIPQASRDFVGEWGGRLYVEAVTGDVHPPRHSIMSLVFGERAGTVFMHTTAFAGPNARIVRTAASVVDPRRVKIDLIGFELNYRPPLRHVERIRLELVGRNRLNCSKTVDFYQSGRQQPIASVDYRGTLRIMDDELRRELEREVIEHGGVPQGEIEDERRFSP